MRNFLLAFMSCMLFAGILPVNGISQNMTPADQMLKQMKLSPRLGESLPLDLIFQNEQGENVRLGSLFRDKPVVLMPVYYECPMLCGLVLKGFLKTLKPLSFTVGEEFDVITFTIDPGENAQLALQKEANVLKDYGRDQAETGWHFLTAADKPETIQALTDAMGFHYVYDAESDEFGHPAAIMVITPEGKISRYFSGVEFSTKDLRLALVEASNREIGSWVDQALLFCFHYDPVTGRYGLVIQNILRLAGALTAGLLFSFIALSIVHEKRGTEHR